MLVVGRASCPGSCAQVARTGSRELFTLAVLAIALGIASARRSCSACLFALGAFFAGVVLSESDFSHQAAADSLPLQDAFAVLFFVSVGMLFDPTILVREPLVVLAVLLVIVVGKSLAAFADRAGLRLPGRDGADGLGEPGADRRVLVHPGRARLAPGAPSPAPLCSSSTFPPSVPPGRRPPPVPP